VPGLTRRRGTGSRGGASSTPGHPVARQRPRTSEPGDINPFDAPAQRFEPASIGDSHVGATHLRFQDRKRQGDANSFLTGAAGTGTGGYRARFAQRRRTQPPGGNPRVDPGPVYRGAAAFRFTTEWHADVERFGASAGFDVAAAEKRLNPL